MSKETDKDKYEEELSKKLELGVHITFNAMQSELEKLRNRHNMAAGLLSVFLFLIPLIISLFIKMNNVVLIDNLVKIYKLNVVHFYLIYVEIIISIIASIVYVGFIIVPLLNIIKNLQVEYVPMKKELIEYLKNEKISFNEAAENYLQHNIKIFNNIREMNENINGLKLRIIEYFKWLILFLLILVLLIQSVFSMYNVFSIYVVPCIFVCIISNIITRR